MTGPDETDSGTDGETLRETDLETDGSALLRYRVLAYVVGVGLIVLVFVGVPLQFGAGLPQVAEIVGPIHGTLYIVYLVVGGGPRQKVRFADASADRDRAGGPDSVPDVRGGAPDHGECQVSRLLIAEGERLKNSSTSARRCRSAVSARWCGAAGQPA